LLNTVCRRRRSLPATAGSGWRFSQEANSLALADAMPPAVAGEAGTLKVNATAVLEKGILIDPQQTDPD
jgi:hypothetical protein